MVPANITAVQQSQSLESIFWSCCQSVCDCHGRSSSTAISLRSTRRGTVHSHHTIMPLPSLLSATPCGTPTHNKTVTLLVQYEKRHTENTCPTCLLCRQPCTALLQGRLRQHPPTCLHPCLRHTPRITAISHCDRIDCIHHWTINSFAHTVHKGRAPKVYNRLYIAAEMIQAAHGMMESKQQSGPHMRPNCICRMSLTRGHQTPPNQHMIHRPNCSAATRQHSTKDIAW